MDAEEFWERCASAGCVVLAVKTYSRFNEGGNLSEEDYLGLRFAAMHFDEEAVGPDYWFMIDEGQAGEELLFSSPEEALSAFEKEHKCAAPPR